MKGEWLLWLSQSGRVIEASDDLCRELGYSKADITSLIIAPISEDDPVVNWSERWRTLCLVGLETYSAHLMARSGQLIPVAVRATYTKIDSVEHDCALLSLSRNADTVASGSSEAESTANAWMSYSFYEAMSEGVAFHRVVTDSNGAPVDYVILDVNSKYTEVVGKSRADVIGKLATEVYGAGEAPYLAIYAGVARTGQNTQFEVFYPPLAKFLHISVVSFKRDYFATIFTDQTDAKLRTAQTDVLLREARVNAAGLDAAIESLARGVFICDTDAKIVRVNAEATSILGYTLDDDIKTAWDVKVLLEPETVDGQTIRIELARLTDGEEKRYLNAFGEIARRAAYLLSRDANLEAVTGGGHVYLRFYGSVPTPYDIGEASKELARYVMAEVNSNPVSITLWPVAARYPTLNRLGAHVAHLDHDGPTTLVPDASPSRANMKNALASFVPMTGQKKAKVADYADGKPIWLAMYCDTKLFYPLGVVQALAEVDDFDPRPFDRVLVGCFTAGVTFIEPDRRPIYTDLSS